MHLETTSLFINDGHLITCMYYTFYINCIEQKTKVPLTFDIFMRTLITINFYHNACLYEVVCTHIPYSENSRI